MLASDPIQLVVAVDPHTHTMRCGALLLALAAGAHAFVGTHKTPFLDRAGCGRRE